VTAGWRVRTVHHGPHAGFRSARQAPRVAVAAFVNEFDFGGSQVFFRLSAQHISKWALNRIFAHQLKLSGRFFFQIASSANVTLIVPSRNGKSPASCTLLRSPQDMFMAI